MAGAPPKGQQQESDSQIAELRKLIAEMQNTLSAQINGVAEGQKALAEQVKGIEGSSAAAAASAKEAAEKAATAANDAKASADQAVKDVKAATDAVAKLEPRMKKVETDHGGLGTRIDDLTKALGGEPIQLDGNGPGLAPFLQIRLREMEFDPLVRRAIAAVAKEMAEDPARLANDIIAKGLGTAVGKVTDRLSRMRMSEPKRHLLAAAYPSLLRQRLGDPIKAELVQDPVGLADSLVADLDLKDGAMDALAKAVIASSEQTLSLNLDASKREALTLRVRESI